VKWLEVSLTTSAENAEAVADVLTRFAPDGAAISGEPDPPDAAWTVRAYLPEAAASESTQLQIREAVWHLSQIATLPEPAFRWVEGEDWSESWKKHFHPIAVGKRLLVLPSWVRPDDPTRLPLILEPGMAFGTGSHPSTRQCLAALEDLLRPEDLVVDVGCGSGILGVAALLLGARSVVACDLDPLAVSATLRSAELNHVRPRLEVMQGSLAETRAHLGDRTADGLVANILAPILARMLNEGLGQMVRPGGWAVLAGILAEQRQLVVEAAAQARLSLAAETAEGDWVALTFRRQG
jgi:ribosomal protein L11 methyltransferase